MADGPRARDDGTVRMDDRRADSRRRVRWTLARSHLQQRRVLERGAGLSRRGIGLLGGLEEDEQRMIEVLVLRIVPYAVLGALIGAAYFAALGWNVRLYADRGAGLSALL